MAAQWKVVKSRVGLWIFMALFIMIVAPSPSFSAGSIQTIQIGSHLSETTAERQYQAVLELLQEGERSSLRIEKIGRYYVLRLGIFADVAGADLLFRRIQPRYSDALLMSASDNPDRIVKIYRPEDVDEVVIEEKDEPQVSSTTGAESSPAEQEDIAVIAPAPVVAAVLPPAGAIVAKPAEMTVEVVKAVATAVATPAPRSDGLLLTLVAVLSLTLLGFYAWALTVVYPELIDPPRQTGPEGPPSDTTIAPLPATVKTEGDTSSSSFLGLAAAVPVAALQNQPVEREAAHPASAVASSSQEIEWADMDATDAVDPFAAKREETVEPQAPVAFAAIDVPEDPPSAESPASEAELAKQDNRMTRAVVAAIFMNERKE